ncbi:hypothetical protein [Rhodococcus sp. 05-2255-3B1]|uniref:hypothetical protein n=1 Tax=Rhodococcus sp. 05-2255-3B1 TaxID=2022482 RepID=UPI0015C5933E|nr:hypothetical protein [Rhodococcus sp. 05-2255-3B1]
MNSTDYSDVRTRHRREIRNDPWPRHESDHRILALGFATVMAVLIVVVTAVAVMWP